MYYKMKHRF